MFRPLGKSDAAMMAALHAICFDKPWGESEFVSLLETGAIGIGNECAFILLRPAADEAEIITLGTHPDFRRAGLAVQLLYKVEENLLAQGITRLFLEVRVDNEAAQKLYFKAGYEGIAVRQGYYTLPDGRQVDAVVMQKIINTVS